MPILEGKLYYTYTREDKPDSYKGKEFWKATLVPDEASTKKAKELGMVFKPASGQIMEPNLVFKRNVLTKDGRRAEAPIVVDAKKNPWPEKVVIGNGSRGKVKFSLIPLKEGPYCYLEKIQILDLVPYGNDEDFDEEDGIEVGEYVAESNEESFGNATSGEETSDPDFD